MCNDRSPVLTDKSTRLMTGLQCSCKLLNNLPNCSMTIIYTEIEIGFAQHRYYVMHTSNQGTNIITIDVS